MRRARLGGRALLRYITRRVAWAIPTFVGISIVAFVIIQLPPGDYLTTLQAQLASQGEQANLAQLEALSQRYGLDQPMATQYWKWISGIVLRGDFGQSFEWNLPVASLIAARLPWTLLLATSTLLVACLVAIPVGVYTAVKQYSLGDYLATFFVFTGLAIPNFLIALVIMWLASVLFGVTVGGFFSPEFLDAGWSLGKLLDLLSHLWIPVLVLGVAVAAGLIRVLRGNLLDELRRPYVVAARARGMKERRLIIRYPLRVAMNPFVSMLGFLLAVMVSSEIIVAQVLSLPSLGPLLLSSLTSQDMYLAGSIILVVSVMTVVGMFVSDLLLAALDPRIRLG